MLSKSPSLVSLICHIPGRGKGRGPVPKVPQPWFQDSVVCSCRFWHGQLRFPVRKLRSPDTQQILCSEPGGAPTPPHPTPPPRQAEGQVPRYCAPASLRRVQSPWVGARVRGWQRSCGGRRHSLQTPNSFLEIRGSLPCHSRPGQARPPPSP